MALPAIGRQPGVGLTNLPKAAERLWWPPRHISTASSPLTHDLLSTRRMWSIIHTMIHINNVVWR